MNDSAAMRDTIARALWEHERTPDRKLHTWAGLHVVTRDVWRERADAVIAALHAKGFCGKAGITGPATPARTVAPNGYREAIARTLLRHPVSDHAAPSAPEVVDLCESAADAVLAALTADGSDVRERLGAALWDAMAHEIFGVTGGWPGFDDGGLVGYFTLGVDAVIRELGPIPAIPAIPAPPAPPAAGVPLVNVAQTWIRADDVVAVYQDDLAQPWSTIHLRGGHVLRKPLPADEVLTILFGTHPGGKGEGA